MKKLLFLVALAACKPEAPKYWHGRELACGGSNHHVWTCVVGGEVLVCVFDSTDTLTCAPLAARTTPEAP